MEIQYRCWSYRKQRMYYPGEFRVKFNLDKRSHILLCDKNEPNKHNEKKRDYKLMVWTSLRDCHGREIFEGDIVTSPELPFNTSIVFERGAFRLSTRAIPMFIIEASKFEVIGNIYENPQLLKTVDK